MRRSTRRRSRDRPRSGRAGRAGRSSAGAAATGATIARPSVVLWSAKPITRKAPSASAPTAYADPIASPSPRLCRPIAIATSSASAAAGAPVGVRDRRSCAKPCASTAAQQQGTRRSPRGTRAPARRVPASPCPATSMPSSVASIARKPSRPIVSAIRTRTQRGSMRRTNGSHSIPDVTGMIPTYNPSSAISP